MSKLIGTAPNQVPSNADLGTMAYQDYDVVATQLMGGRRNIIINGAMQVAQRGTSGSISNAYTCDRWDLQGSETFSWEQVSDSPPGFSSSLKMTNTNNGSSSSTYREFLQRIEGFNMQGWDYTNSSAFITVSFWAKSSLAGTYGCSFRTSDGTSKYYSDNFTLEANTWKKHTLTIPGNSSSTINNDNGEGAAFFIIPHYGTNYANASSNRFWAGNLADNLKTYPQNWANTTNATFQITGIQLEMGSVATPFEHRSFGEELALCQRYYFKSYNQGVDPGAATSTGMFRTEYREGYQHSGWIEMYGFKTPCEMRAQPSMTIYDHAGTINNCTLYIGTSQQSGYSFTKNVNGTNSFGGYSDRTTVKGGWGIHVTLDAEL